MRVHTANNRIRMLLAAAILLTAALGACADDDSSLARSDAGSRPTVARPKISEAGGDVASDSAPPAVRWLDDANAVALFDVMNGRQLAAADAELSTWHVDTVRAFAAEMAREHSALQRSIDSAAAALALTPVTPALAALVRARMQAQIDSIYEHAGRGFDRAYLDQAVASHQLMHEYLLRLSAVAANPGLQDVLQAASDSVKSQLARAKALRAAFAAADSAAADSAAKRAARRAARLKGEGNR
jgi:predicted outer membrane protein